MLMRGRRILRRSISFIYVAISTYQIDCVDRVGWPVSSNYLGRNGRICHRIHAPPKTFLGIFCRVRRVSRERTADRRFDWDRLEKIRGADVLVNSSLWLQYALVAPCSYTTRTQNKKGSTRVAWWLRGRPGFCWFSGAPFPSDAVRVHVGTHVAITRGAGRKAQ